MSIGYERAGYKLCCYAMLSFTMNVRLPSAAWFQTDNRRADQRRTAPVLFQILQVSFSICRPPFEVLPSPGREAVGLIRPGVHVLRLIGEGSVWLYNLPVWVFRPVLTASRQAPLTR